MRIALPVKVFLSYLLVVSAGAIPTYVYFRTTFQRKIIQQAEKDLGQRVLFLVRALKEKTPADRREEVQRLALTTPERITYIAADGQVLFDSQSNDLQSLSNHFDRPEVQQALGKKVGQDPSAPHLPGVGFNRRFSNKEHTEILYAATAVDIATKTDVLLLSMPMTSVLKLQSDMLIAFRNSQATAVSVAIFLSMAAAFLIMRPLQKITIAAQDLAAGDYTISLQKLAIDEIGDVGRSLLQMSTQVRRRLALAENGQALLVQLVSSLDLPIAVFDPEGRIVAINGAAREVLFSIGMGSDEGLTHLVNSASYQAAITQAETKSEPAPLRLDTFPNALGPMIGFVHVLKQPDLPPYGVFIGSEAHIRQRSLLPAADRVTAVTLDVVIAQAVDRAAAFLAPFHITLGELPTAGSFWIADVDRRMSLALALALEGTIPHLTGPDNVLGIALNEEPTRVAVVLRSVISLEAQEIVRLLLDPVGGDLVISTSETCLWLPKA
jgi:HAMP domain-containing protein